MNNKTTDKKPNWTFLSNHAHVILCLAQSPSIRIRDLSAQVGITERAVQRIIAKLVEEGYLEKTKEGRRNLYSICCDKPLKHSIESHKNVNDLLKLIYP